MVVISNNNPGLHNVFWELLKENKEERKECFENNSIVANI